MDRPPPIARFRPPWHRRVRADPAVIRRWGLVAVLTLVTALLVADVTGQAEEVRQRWGRTVPVWVTVRSLDGGDEIVGAVEQVEWPAALVPPNVVDQVPAGARASRSVDEGMPVSAGLLAGRGDQVDDAHRVAVPWSRAGLPVEVGDMVDVWATFDPSLAGRGPATRRVARRGSVTAVDDRAVTVAVGETEVAEVAEAVALATVSVVQVA